MQFTLIDQIVCLEPGKRIVATKNLTLGEEYLQDHFPGFPVLPGVLMLEAMVQAGAWLIRVTEDYSQSMILVRSAKALKYGNFVAPGDQLVLDLELKKLGAETCEFRGKGMLNGAVAVSGRLELEKYNLADRDPSLRAIDERMIQEFRLQYSLLARGLNHPVPESAMESITA